ncbi:MAG: ATP-dependent RNA helicase HrpA [Phycisphaerales bacterium]|nr:ATP-dependent RNA helicase HrpA [Phycisphaerales bacterium]
MSEPKSPPNPTLDELLKRCPPAMRGRFIGRIRGLERKSDPKHRAKIEQSIEADLQRAIEAFERRKSNVPKVSYPEDLPVSQRRDEIIEAIRANQVVIVCGETGSGKTTQLPKMCLQLGLGVGAMIGHTQPRRIAARSVASRLAEELGVKHGEQVGSKIRFSDTTTDNTYIKVMTDGILLAETRSDPKLRQYDAIIIDEAHERSLNIDFLLGYMHRLLHSRPDLKLIITSATIDADRFAEHFGTKDQPAPVIEVSGRTYPVEMRYEPDHITSGMNIDEAASYAAAQLINERHDDVLIFMPGEREIRQTAHELRKRDHLPEGTEIIPLYARLSAAEQQRVFKPSGRPRVIIATNVAETSLTVPNIKSVVDPGSARMKRYNPRTKIHGLLVEPISQASANQRAGRCGRIAPGVCVRLYSETDFETRDAFTQPELLRSNLASVILQMADLNLGEPESFPFLDRPEHRQWRDGFETLRELGAIEEDGRLTGMGKTMARLPVDPRIARMVLAAKEERCVHDVLIIASALSSQDPRVRPHEKRDAADQAHEQFRVEGSDFLAYLKIWDWYHQQHLKLTRRKLAKACEKAYLSARRIDEWREVYRQLRSLCIDMGINPEKGHNDPDAVHRALLAGLLANIGTKGETHEFKGARNSTFSISPGSALFSAKPKWVMCAEIVRTSKVYARTVAGIDTKWIEDAAAHLIKKTHSDPRWDEQSGRVVADEKVTLFGLDIVPRRTVHYGPIDPKLSRELFIHHALIDEQMRSASKALRHNHRLIREIGTLQAKARRNDLIADTQTLFSFYDARLPKDIYASKAFDRWARKAEASDPNVLKMTRADVLEHMPEEVTPEAYPDAVSFAGATSKLKYAFEPGREDDGATIRVSVAALHQLTRQRVDWSVPGLIRPRIEALVRSLPKQLRRQFDANQIAGELAPTVREDRGSIEAQLAEVLSARTGIAVRPEDFRRDQLESYLFPRIEVIDEHGHAIEASRDLGKLQAKFAGEATKVVQQAGAGIEQTGMTGWEFDELPETIEFSRPGSPKVIGFPSLIVEDGKVSLKVLATRWESDLHTRSGLGLLYGLAIRRELRLRLKNLPGFTRLHMLAAACSMADQLETIVWTRVGTIICVDNQPIPRTKEEFELGLLGAWDRGVDETNRVITNLTQIFDSLMRARGRLDEQHPSAWTTAIKDMRRQLEMLIADGALITAETRWLWCYARFLRAMEVRLDKLRSIGPERDAKAADRVYAWTQCLRELMAQGAHTAEVAEDFWTLRWMVEEFRVATFAQNLRTSMQVSEKRLREQLDRILHA